MEEEALLRHPTVASAAANFIDQGTPRSGQEQQMSGRDRAQIHADGNNWGLKDERILALVFAALNWDPHVLSMAACVSRRLRAVAKRVLWRELCLSRAPRMVTALVGAGGGGSGGWRMAMNGGWHALAKLFFFCCGCAPSRHFRAGRASPGHFVGVSRFSKTSGRSFLARRCWGDLLYVSDPCEHPAAAPGAGYDVGVYRGVFGGFMRSRTRACLIARQAELEARVRCPYCGARVWSMTAARLVPRSAARRLGSPHDGLDYFVCVNGHLHGYCWLAHLSSSSSSDEDDEGSGTGTSTGGGGGCWDDDDDDDDADVVREDAVSDEEGDDSGGHVAS